MERGKIRRLGYISSSSPEERADSLLRAQKFDKAFKSALEEKAEDYRRIATAREVKTLAQAKQVYIG